MDNTEDQELKRSTLILKQAVPLMVKNRIAPIPANYALWYTYVDQEIPQLNQAVDQAIAQFGYCPPSTNRKLYLEYIANRAETDLHQFRSNIEILLQELSSSMHDTISNTDNFSKLIEKNFNNLERLDHEKLSIEDILTIVRQFTFESKDIRHSTQFLQGQLNSASQEIHNLKTQLTKLQHDALFDSLTDLYNRRAFDSDIDTVLQAKPASCLILMDIDHFKSFNDNYGHLLGDAILKATARRLQSHCREDITAYRFGGEEFAIIVPGKSVRIARQFAESLRRTMTKLKIKDRRSGSQVSDITASFGVAEFDPSKESVHQFIARTDALLYEAKKLGRNRVMPII